MGQRRAEGESRPSYAQAWDRADEKPSSKGLSSAMARAQLLVSTD